MTLQEGQFSLDGYVFGSVRDAAVVLSSGWDQGETGWRTQDANRPAADGLFVGRDYLTPPLWTFEVGVRADTSIYAEAEALSRAFRGDAVRGTPGQVSELRYLRDGVERVVFGRGRGLTQAVEDVRDDTWRIFHGSFQLTDPLSYAAEERSTTLGLVTTAGEGSGLVLPETLPWFFDYSPAAHAMYTTVDSVVPVPFKVWIRGPVAGQARDFRLEGPGWTLGLATYLSPGGNITVDTATGSVVRNSAPSGGILTVDSDPLARLPGGAARLIFTADDPTASTTCTVSWRDAATIH